MVELIHTIRQIRILKRFWKRLNREKFLNNRSGSYFSRLDNQLTVPSLVISGISSFISLLSTSDMFSSDQKQICSIVVGLFVGIATILSSVSTSYGFSSKKEQFAVAADQYDKLLTKIEFEILNPNEEFNMFCDTMESSILDIKSNCRHLPPPFVHRIYANDMEAEMDESLIVTPTSTPSASMGTTHSGDVAALV